LVLVVAADIPAFHTRTGRPRLFAKPAPTWTGNVSGSS
jgi:hypothetical protein